MVSVHCFHFPSLIFIIAGNLSLNDRIRNYLDILKVYSDSASDSGKFTNEELMDIRKALTFNHYHSGMHLPTHSHAPPSIIYNYDKQCFEMSDFQGAPMSMSNTIIYFSIFPSWQCRPGQPLNLFIQ